MEKKYDSTVDALKHIENIKKVAKPVLDDLNSRIENHDQSKLEEPERSCYDEMIPQLKTAKYGTKEYYNIRAAMFNRGLKHHYKENRHHPEHFKNGIREMNLVDMLEMMCDWYAASMTSDTGFETGFEQNCDRFKIDGSLKEVLWNTYLEYFRGK